MKKFIIALCLSFVTIMSFSQQVVGQKQSAIRVQMTSENFYLTEHNSETNTDYFYNSDIEVMYGCWYDSEYSNYCYQLGIIGTSNSIKMFNGLVDAITEICYKNEDGLYLNYLTGLAYWIEYDNENDFWKVYSIDINYLK